MAGAGTRWTSPGPGWPALGVPVERAVEADERAAQVVAGGGGRGQGGAGARPVATALTDVWADGGSEWRT